MLRYIKNLRLGDGKSKRDMNQYSSLTGRLANDNRSPTPDGNDGCIVDYSKFNKITRNMLVDANVVR